MFASTDSAQLPLQGVSFQPLDDTLAAQMAREVVAIDPWATLGTKPEALHGFLVGADPHCHKRLIRYRDAPAGLVAVRNPWLYGPYISLLVVLPSHQGLGLGSAVLASIEQQVDSSDKNIWVCASTFNSFAIDFYIRRGFEPVGDLPDLVRVGFTETLFRKRLRV